MKNPYVSPIAKGKFSVAFSEQKDCTIRALANAADMSYEECHGLFEAKGRIRGQGCKIKVFDPIYEQCGFELMDVFGTTQAANIYRAFKKINHVTNGITLGKMVDVLQEGRYIVLVAGHALAVVDGEVIDNASSRAGCRVVSVYKQR